MSMNRVDGYFRGVGFDEPGMAIKTTTKETLDISDEPWSQNLWLRMQNRDIDNSHELYRKIVAAGIKTQSARTIERVLKEGYPPSKTLRRAFGRFFGCDPDIFTSNTIHPDHVLTDGERESGKVLATAIKAKEATAAQLTPILDSLMETRHASLVAWLLYYFHDESPSD